MAKPSATVRETILTVAGHRRTFKTSDVLGILPRKVSRQHVSATLRQLVEEGTLVKAGATRGATYALPQYASILHPIVKRRLRNQDLREDEVLDDVRRKAPFLAQVPRNAGEIFTYAFLEMLNNAIEHSRSPVVEVEASKNKGDLWFVANDFGIGVFRNVMQQRHLNSELEAMQDLLKGKTTTQPEAHSGEGIFFTSKVADLFILESFTHRLRVDNTIRDHFIETMERSKRGTRVTFRISETTSRRLRDVFEKYTVEPSAPGFDQSEVQVKLYALGTPYISRSQARRMLSGLEKFRSVILDFGRVPTIGQAFADEVFRVFQRQHPDVVIKPSNMNEAVKFMVERARGT